ncbi:MAG: hypothetical protein WCC64_11320 [Aliidongia sp.]
MPPDRGEQDTDSNDERAAKPDFQVAFRQLNAGSYVLDVASDVLDVIFAGRSFGHGFGELTNPLILYN